MIRNKPEITNYRYLIGAGVFLLYLILFLCLFNIAVHFIHETGHILFGFLDGLIKGEIITYSISSWVVEPFTNLKILPQQIRIIDGTKSLNFKLGGPAFSIIVFTMLSWLGYKLSGQKIWFLLFFSVALFEISANIICGTDNSTGNPFSFCNNNFNLLLIYISYFTFASILAFLSTQRIVQRLRLIK